MLPGKNRQPEQPAQRPDERSITIRSIEGFITWAAAATALFGGVVLYDVTAALVRAITLHTWGEGWLALIDFCWRITCFPLVFFAARASYYALFAALMVVGIRYLPSLAF